MLTIAYLSLDSAVVPSQHRAFVDLGVKAAIRILENGVYYGFDLVGAHIWNLIQTPRTVQRLRGALFDECDVDADRRERDLFALPRTLTDSDLIDVADHE